jgi:hypothetical protein
MAKKKVEEKKVEVKEVKLTPKQKKRAAFYKMLRDMG